jgi:DNA recombination-dependent growth factor C
LSLCRYRLLGGTGRRNSLASLNELFAAYRSGPVKLSGVTREEVVGWVRPLGLDMVGDEVEDVWDLTHCEIDEGFLLRMRIERRKAPAQLIQMIYKQRFLAHQRESGKAPGPKLRKELKEQVKMELTTRALPQLAYVDAFWRDREGELMLFATGKKLRDTFQRLFHETFATALGLTLVSIDPPLMGLARDAWEDSAVASETLGRLSLATPMAIADQIYP